MPKADFWTTDLEDEPCDFCQTKPSKHYGHGTYVCKTCYDSWWCPKCTYRLGRDHVCVTPEQHAEHEKQLRAELAELGIDYDETDGGS